MLDKKFRGTFAPGSYDVGLKNALDNNFFGEKKPGHSFDRSMPGPGGGKQSSTFAFSRMAKDNILSPKSSQKRHEIKRGMNSTVSRQDKQR